MHELARLVPGLGERGAQALVPGHHVPQRGGQGLPVQCAGEAQRHGDVVGAARFPEAVEEPQASLGVRQRHHVRPVHRDQRGPAVAGVAQALGQLRDGRRLEDRSHGQLDAQGGANGVDQADRQQRMAAQLEEAVVDPDAGHPQHLGEQAAEGLLPRCAGGAAAYFTDQVRHRQEGAVELAVLGDGQGVEHHERGGDHVVGQPLAQVVAQGGVQLPGLAEGDRVVGEAARVRLLVVTGGVRGQGVGRGGGRGGHEQCVQPAVGVALGPGQYGPVAEFRAQRDEVPGVHSAGTVVRLPHAGEVLARHQGPGGRRLGGGAGVRHARHPDALRPVAVESGPQRGQARDVVGPAPHGSRGEGDQVLGPLAVQDDVVAVPAELVVVPAALDPDVHAAHVGVAGAQAVEERGRDEEFLLLQHAPVDVPAQRVRALGVRRAREGDRRVEAAQEREVAYVADEHRAAGDDQVDGLGQHGLQVSGVREVLGDGVDHDGVEVALGEPVEVVGGLDAQFDAVVERGVAAELVPERGDRLGGEVGRPVGLAVPGEPAQDEPAADADLQDAAGPQRTDALHDGLAPLVHLLQGERFAVVAAVPAGEVLAEPGVGGAAVHAVVDLLPLGDLLAGARLEAVGQPLPVGDHIADELRLAPVVGAGEHLGLADVRVLGDGRGDLARLDAEAADLDLVVGASGELQLPVGVPPCQVAGAVHPGPGRAEGVGDELFGGAAGEVEVAAGEAGAGEVDLSRHALGNGPQVRVQDVGPGVGERAPDGHGRAGGVGGAHLVLGRAEGGLGGPVQLTDDRAGGVFEDALHRDRRDDVAAGEDFPHAREGAGRVLGEHPEEARGEVHRGDLLLSDQAGERGGVQAAGRGEHDQPAGQKGHPQLVVGDVEGVRRVQQDALVVSGVPARVAGQRQELAVRDGHALGGARGAGGVHDVGELVRVDRHRRVVGGLVGQGGVVVEDDHRRVVLEAAREHGPVGEQHARPGVGHDPLEPLGGERLVQRYVGAAGLEHGEDGHRQLRRALQEHGDPGLRADTEPDEAVGQPVGALVQLAAGQFAVARADGGGVGSGGGDLGEPPVHGGGGAALLAPGAQQPLALLGGQDVDGAEVLAGVAGDGGQQPGESFRHCRGGVPVEEVGAELQDAGDPARGVPGAEGLRDVERQVELGGPQSVRLHRHAQAGERQLGLGVVLQREEDLEQGVLGERAHRVEQLHQPLEGHVLVAVGREGGLADPPQQVAEARVAGGVGAQHEGVDEEADLLVERGVRAARDGAADRDVGARAQPGAQGGHGGLEHHEQADVVALGEVEEACVERGVELDVHGVAAEAELARPRPVGGQGQLLGQSAQRAAPEVGLGAQGAVRVVLVAQHRTLPQRVVRVLDGQRRPVGARSAEPGRVGGPQVTGERCHGPAVAGDVVQDQQQDVLFRAEREEVGPQGEFGGEVEAERRGGREGFGEPVLGRGRDGQRGAGGGGVEDPLAGFAAGLGVDGAQRFVPGRQVGQGRVERGAVEPAGEPQRRLDVVGGPAVLHPVEEPQAPLAVGEGEFGRSVGGGEGRAGPVAAGEAGRELLHGGRLEDGAHRKLDPEPGADAVGQTGGQQRMAARVEEVVVDADGGHPEHLGEQAAEDLLLRRARPAAGGRGGEVGGGQGPAVELAVGGQGQRVQPDDRGRHHVRGQPFGEVGAEHGRIGGVRAGHHVGDQPLLAGRVLVHHDGGPVDGRVPVQGALDLAEFDAEAADLDLVVDPVEEFQLSVGAAAHEVAGAVHPGARRAVGVGHEALGGEPGPVQVAAGDAGTGEVELARHAVGHRPQAAVEYVRTGVGERQADGRPSGVLLAQGRRGGPDRRLGRPVDVGDLPRGRPQRARERLGQRLAADQDPELSGVLGVPGGQQALPQRGGRLHHGGARGGDELAQGVRVPARLLRREHEPPTADERQEELEVGDVEAERRHRQQAVPGPEGEPVPEVREQVDEVLAGDDGSLGRPGGPGGVDDVGGTGAIALLERHSSNPRRDACDALLAQPGGSLVQRRVKTVAGSRTGPSTPIDSWNSTELSRAISTRSERRSSVSMAIRVSSLASGAPRQ